MFVYTRTVITLSAFVIIVVYCLMTFELLIPLPPSVISRFLFSIPVTTATL